MEATKSASAAVVSVAHGFDEVGAPFRADALELGGHGGEETGVVLR